MVFSKSTEWTKIVIEQINLRTKVKFLIQVLISLLITTLFFQCIDTLFNPPENSDDLKKAMSFLENLHKYISTNQLVPAKSKEEQDKEREEKERTEKKLKELQNEVSIKVLFVF